MNETQPPRWPYKLLVQLLYSRLPGVVVYGRLAMVEIPALCRHLNMKRRRFLEHVDELERIGLISDLEVNKSAAHFKIKTPRQYELAENKT